MPGFRRALRLCLHRLERGGRRLLLRLSLADALEVEEQLMPLRKSGLRGFRSGVWSGAVLMGGPNRVAEENSLPL